MTQSDDPGDHKKPPKSAATALVLLMLAVGAGFGVYRLSSHWSAPDIRAQEAPQEPTFLIRQGSRIIVPENSPVRNKLQIEPVEERDVQRTLTLPAVVEADPARTVKVLPPVTGRVIDLKVQLGERVSQDQDLAVLDSGDLAQAFSDDEKARAQLKLTKQALDRLMILAKTSAVAIKDREQAENDYAQAQSELERAQIRLRSLGISADQKPSSRLLTLKAPITGSVIDLQIAKGDFLNDPTAAAITIANLDTVWATANVPEKDTALVTKGQSVDVVFTAYPKEVFKGNVLFVSDILDSDTRRTKVRIAFENQDLRLKPNMFANATFLAPSRNMPSILTTALVLRDEVDQVFVEVEPWTFEARPVDVAFQQDDRAVIERGLKPGERIVVKGGALLND
jgi:cobalt-zinc-cadmium efflux system membrane fusion protein